MRAIAVVVMLIVGWSAPATARPADKALRAARLLRTWQFDQARALITTLVANNPSAKETRYLQAELDFVDGRYDKAIAGLDGLADGDIEGNVGALRSLAASTFAVTQDYRVSSSPGGHFEIYYAPGKDKAIVDLTGEVLEAAYEALGNDLGHRPSTPIRVELLQKASELASVSTLTEAEIETTGTIALCKYGKLMVVTPRATVFGYPWMDTLTHEYVHYIVTQMSNDNVPVWLHEGLARYLQIRWRAPADGALGTRDEHLLATALKKNKLVSFDDMHPSMAKLPSQDMAALAFAEVGTMVSFVHKTVGNEGLQKIITSQKRGMGARKAVAEVMKRDWSAVESDWKKNLRDSRLQSKQFADRSQRIRFKKGSGNDDNVGIEAIRSKKARKFTRLAGMLRARGKPAAAAIEYEKALSQSSAGDPLISAKLSRVYLELGRYEEAIKLAQPLLAIDEMNSVPPTTLGAAYLASGDHKRAGESFELALRINPFDPSVRCGLAKSYRASGDKRAAREQDACQLLQQVR